MLTKKNIALSTAIVGCISLVGCASAPKAPPAFDPNASALAQAATFIADNGKTKALKDIKRVVVTGCNVLFAENSAASAATGDGMFAMHSGAGSSRVDSTVSVIYTLKGVSDAQQQKMANEICAGAETRLRAAGFEVVPTAEALKADAFKALLAAGKQSPFNFKSPGKNNKTTYNIFAPTGYTVYDQRYLGTVGGLGQAFKAAAGNSAVQMEGLLMKQLNASAVSINVMVDFAQLQSDGKQSGWSGKNSANVSHGVALGITGLIDIKPLDQLKCWKRFGKEECMLNGVTPTFVSKLPVTTNEKFYSDITNATTTGDKVAAGFTKTLATLSALSGTNSRSFETTRYQVNAQPAAFEKATNQGVNGFLDMAFIYAKSKQ